MNVEVVDHAMEVIAAATTTADMEAVVVAVSSCVCRFKGYTLIPAGYRGYRDDRGYEPRGGYRDDYRDNRGYRDDRYDRRDDRRGGMLYSQEQS